MRQFVCLEITPQKPPTNCKKKLTKSSKFIKDHKCL